MANADETSTEIPEPADSGSTGMQQPTSTDIIALPKENLFERDVGLEGVVLGLAATSSRKMGGEVVAQLMSGIAGEFAKNLREAETECAATRSQLNDVRDQLSNCRIQKAVLSERVSTYEGNRHLRNFAIFGGTTLLGIAFELHKSEFQYLALLLGGVGLGLILMGWLRQKSEPVT